MTQQQSLLDRLAAHRTIGAVPRDQLQWLIDNGHPRTVEVGDFLTRGGEPVRGMYVILDGHLTLRVDRGTGAHIVMEWHGGDVTGVLPYSRIASPPGDVIAEQRTDTLMVEVPTIARMIAECHELTAVLVHVMIDRARVFKSSELHDEKMASLGRLAAGLAHELNNPASAVARSARTLVSELDALERSTKRYCQLNLSVEQQRAVSELRAARSSAPTGGSPLDIADREDALAEWLEAHHVPDVPLEQLAASAFAPTDLDALATTVGEEKIGAALAHISADQTVRRLASEISVAASRIHALVGAVKGFTYMDQQATLQPVEIGRGLSDTVTVLSSKARGNSVELRLDVAPDLPPVDGYGGELNQVWANLLDNAIDASPRGHVRVSAGVEAGKVVVRIADDGHGIPADVLSRIFDPFFTTKPVGSGTGLGLDIAKRIVHRHHGALDVTSSERGTEFLVTLPVRA